MAVGQGLEWVSSQTGVMVSEVAERSVWIGDSVSDFAMSKAYSMESSDTLDLRGFFVGKDVQFFPVNTYKNIIAVAPHVLDDKIPNSYGPNQTELVLKVIIDHCQPLIKK